MRMQNFAAGLIALTAIAGVYPAAAAQEDKKAVEVLAGARKAIGGKKLDSLKTLSVQAAMQRNAGNFQMNSDLELFVELPDKYMRSESSSNAMVNMANTLGFNGDRPLKSNGPAGIAPGGGMMIRMGGPGGPAVGSGEKPTPEQQRQIDRQMVRSARHDISRLMLGWFGMTHPSLTAQYTYAGEAESPDGKAYVIDVKNADGFAARLFIDEDTQLPLMLTYQGPQPRIITAGGPRPAAGGAAPAPPAQPRQVSPQQMSEDERKKLAADADKQIREMEKQAPVMVEYTLFFDDWREEDGIKFPHALRRASGGTTTEEWTVNKVKVNPKIDPKKFETEG
jgi:hypothetical protein